MGQTPGGGRLSRRDTLRLLACAGAVGAAWGLGLRGRSRARAAVRTRVLMGTTVHLTVIGDDTEAASAAADATLGRMAELEARLSRFRPDSEVGRLNASGRITGASDSLLDVLRLAERTARLGDGAFDVTVQPVLDLYRSHLERRLAPPPPQAIERALESVDHRAVRVDGGTVTLARPGACITLDGIAKGYIVDRAVDVLRERSFPDVLVEAGGDLKAEGDKGAGRPWRVGIRRPRQGLVLQAALDARNTAVATSGDYMQPFVPDYSLHHIIDPRTGYSSPDLASATVTAPDAATADALATLVMVLGARAGCALLEELPGCEGYLVSKDLEVTRTSGFATV